MAAPEVATADRAVISKVFTKFRREELTALSKQWACSEVVPITGTSKKSVIDQLIRARYVRRAARVVGRAARATRRSRPPTCSRAIAVARHDLRGSRGD